jgi:hypothetical protein
MTRMELVAFLRDQPWAVEATATADGAPQAAVIGVAIGDELELIFDTLSSSRKHQNLERDPRIAFVIGWDAECTVQYLGRASRPAGEELARLKAVYFARFQDGPTRERWPGIAYWCVRPTWIRWSDFRSTPPTIISWESTRLADLIKTA